MGDLDEEGDELMARLAGLQEAMERHAKEEGLLAGDGSEDEDLEDDTGAAKSKEATDDNEEGQPNSPTAASGLQLPRRRLDQTWEVEAERDFSARAGDLEDSRSRGEAIAAELRSHADLPELLLEPPIPKPGESEAAVSTAKVPSKGVPKSSLRRLKHVEPEVALGVEKECGVQLARDADVYRLVMENLNSSLRCNTRVLLIMASEAMLCEEPISEETATDSGNSTSTPFVPGLPDARPSTEDSNVAAGSDGNGGWIMVELRYFRAAPKRGALEKRLGRVPVLHVTLISDDGTHQAMEFLGVHQRRYCAEDPPSDAISRNLTESLLRVALEFVFHPSRSRYTKDQVILRECSVDSEAVQSRAALLPRMAEKVRELNEKIKQVHLELCDSEPFSRVPNAGISADRKGKSYLVLDEDVLKVAPTKDKLASKAPPAKHAFKGLGSGFLNSAKAKKKGLSDEQATGDSKASDTSRASAASHSSASSSSAGITNSNNTSNNTSTNDNNSPSNNNSNNSADSANSSSNAERSPSALISSIKPEERTRINPEPAESAQPPPVITNAEEKMKLILGAAEPAPGEAQRKATVASLEGPPQGSSSSSSSSGRHDTAASSGVTGAGTSTRRAEADLIEEDDDDAADSGQPTSLSDLANQLFGSLDDELHDELRTEPSEQLTESTGIPSPKACSSREGGPPSESSMSATDAVPSTTTAPASGFRLLQQRRRASGEQPQNAEASSEEASSRPTETTDDLVALWMKQRW
eukprot:TRINITY_DN3896_c1_g2_i1.p1 TRINITY_DN3896_c1_g2~~TRINITY_DN3896_c1_g2_i1.p1  ORF type:complete len:755 (-),score=194.03 TRINITY_DN3896_c1_g2_i1:17-2281(-)